MIDFGSLSTEILLNPRLPQEEAQRLGSMIERLPPLAGHLWMTTSGSSGRLKLVALSKGAILASADAVNRHLRATTRDVWGCPLPLFHVGGLGIVARALRSASRVALLERWSPTALVALVRREGVTLASLVPAQVHDLVAARLRAPASLRAIVVGGGALAPDLYTDARALGWPLLPSYGMTETASQVATAALESLDREELPQLQLLDHLEASVIEGRLAFRGAALLTAYAVERESEPVLVDPKRDGWFVSEDAGTVESSGGRTVVRPRGRSADFLKIGGESVSLARLDAILAAVLREHRGIDAAVVAVPDARLGSVIHLAVSRAEAADEIARAFSERVLPFERPRRIHILEIPRTPLGKLRREEILARLGSGA